MNPIAPWQRHLAWQKLDRHRNKSKQSTVLEEFKIRCSGRLHRVAVISTGNIVLRDHTRDELKAMRLFKALGDKQCECLKVLDEIRTRVKCRQAMIPARDRAERIRKWRSTYGHWKLISKQPPLRSRINTLHAKKQRDARLVANEIVDAINSGELIYPACSKAADATYGDYKFGCSIALTINGDQSRSYVTAAGRYDRRRNMNDTSLEMSIVVGDDWLKTVAANGWTVVDGMLCAYAKPRGETASPYDYETLAGGQMYDVVLGRLELDRSTGFKPVVREWEAVAAVGDDGKLHVASWKRPCDPDVVDEDACIGAYITSGYRVVESTVDLKLRPARIRSGKSLC